MRGRRISGRGNFWGTAFGSDCQVEGVGFTEVCFDRHYKRLVGWVVEDIFAGDVKGALVEGEAWAGVVGIATVAAFDEDVRLWVGDEFEVDLGTTRGVVRSVEEMGIPVGLGLRAVGDVDAADARS